MKKIFFCLVLILPVLDAVAQTYAFDSIPDNLRRRSYAVVRSQQCLYTISKPGSAVEKVKFVITLLNENADAYRQVTVNYDDFSKVNFLRGAVYDEKGEIIKSLGITDVNDVSAYSGSFYTDDRLKYFIVPKYKYPYTIEYEYEKEYSSILNYPYWHFQYNPGISVEKSGIQFVLPKSMNFRYLMKNLKNDIDSVITSDSKIYTWQEENIPAITPQNYNSLTNLYSLPVLFTAPNDFEYGGYKGSMSSWETFGAWNFNLINGRDVLPPEELVKVKEITSKTNDERERARLIYEYVQSKTRYVSIQLGIGGYRPAEASDVAKYGFGDCKALVNYTKALLRAAGITSYYSLIKSGYYEDQIKTGFVSNQFDHIILCLPLQKDTVWLECTSSTLPFNYLGGFTDNRYALMITPEGGKMVKTPAFNSNENIVKRTGSVSVYSNSASLFEISDTYSGFNFGNANQIFGNKSEEEMKRYLNEDLKFYDFRVHSVVYSENKSEKPSAELAYHASVNDFTTVMGKRIYFSPSIEQPVYLQDIPAQLRMQRSHTQIDSISYQLPFGYKVEYLPENISIENEFGKFSYMLELKDSKIIYKRYIAMNEGVIPVEKFNEIRTFVNAVAKADEKKIILTQAEK